MLACIGVWYSCRPGLRLLWLGALENPLDSDADWGWGWVVCQELVST
jgi:hypothetical protein